MPTTLTRHQFSQNTSAAQIATTHGPVFITEQGHPSYVLLSYAEYERLSKRQASIVELLAAPADEGDIAFEPPRSTARWNAPHLNDKDE